MESPLLVRFAPSPTGFLHIGNARIALINWLFAKKNNGKFLLRIDDTDQVRSEKKYEEFIIKDLEWLGLHHDSFSRQSKQLDFYTKAKETLIEQGRLYPCYETQEELEFKRRRQLAKGIPPIYDRSSLQLTRKEQQDYERQGRKPYWRFYLKPGTIRWNDLIRGPVAFETSHLSDPVLIRADGAFLYLLCSVVDDLKYGVTHILRGEDHVTNTAAQIQLTEALNNKNNPFTFGHITLLTDGSGHSFSKREGGGSLEKFREEGFEPMAINSLLARLGTSLPIIPFSEISHLIKGFDLNTFSRTPPRLQIQDLTILNQKLFSNLSYMHIKNCLEHTQCPLITEKVWLVIKDNVNSWEDIVHWNTILSGKQPCLLQGTKEDYTFVKYALALLPKSPWTEETWENWTNALKEKTKRKGKQLFMPLRQILTGIEHGPEMKKIFPLLEYQKVYAHLKETLEHLI